MKKLLTVLLGAAFAVSASPAVAVAPTLPAGDFLFQVECDEDLNDRQLLGVDLDIEELVLIGDGDGAGDLGCVAQGSMDPGTDWFYFVDWYIAGDTLARVNVVSGVVEEIGLMLDEGAEAQIISLAIGPDGNAYALSDENLYGVNLDNGDLFLLNRPNVAALNGGSPYGFAYDPTTEHFYVAEDGDTEIHQLNVETGELSYVTENSDFWIGSMAFDSEGYFWFNGNDSKVRRGSLLNFDDSANVLATGDLLLESEVVYSESIGISRAEIDDSDTEDLAPTGSTDLGGLAVLAGLAAIAALAVRRNATR